MVIGHQRGIRAPKSRNLFFVSLGGVFGFCMCLFVFAFSWIGGDDYVAQLGGAWTLCVLLGGLVVSVGAAFVTSPDD
jgi:hypothetical protein